MENLSFRNLIKPLFAVLLLAGCSEGADKYFISKGLETVFDDYTTRYDKDSIITLRFFKVENRTFFYIGHMPYYDDVDLDGCFICKNKLVLYKSNTKKAIADDLIDSTHTKDKTILKQYTTWDESNMIYCGSSNVETYYIKSQNCIIKATESDLRYREIATDTTGIRNKSINDILNSSLNNCSTYINAILFASYKGNDFFKIANVDSYTSKNLNGCLKRNGRIVTFYNVDNINCSNLLDKQRIRENLYLLNGYKEIDSDEFYYYRTGGEKYYMIKPDESVEELDETKWSDEEREMFYDSFGF